MKNLQKIPGFKSESVELEFWEKHDASKYIDFSKGKRLVLPNLKPSAKTISIRLPQSILGKIKIIAHEKDVPCRSLIIMYLSEKISNDTSR